MEEGEVEMFEHEFGEDEVQEGQFDKTEMEGGEKESDIEDGELAPSVEVTPSADVGPEGLSINDKL